jgi:hypothetical protein
MAASQFVNVVLFQFSGLASFLPAQSLLRSLSCTSGPAKFFFCPLRRSQISFDATRRKNFGLPRIDAVAELSKPWNAPWERSGTL